MVLGTATSRISAAAGLAALLLVTPAARAECAKSTVMCPCVQRGEARAPSSWRTIKSPAYPTGPEPRSVGLVVGGIGVILLSSVAGFFVYEIARDRCGQDPTEYCRRGDDRMAGAAVVSGIAGNVSGIWMIYYGGKHRPPSPPAVSVAPWTSETAHGLSLRGRF